MIDSHPGTVCAVLSGHDHEGEIVFFGESGPTLITMKSGPILIVFKIATKVAAFTEAASGTSRCPGLKKTLTSGSSATLAYFYSTDSTTICFSVPCWSTVTATVGQLLICLRTGLDSFGRFNMSRR